MGDALEAALAREAEANRRAQDASKDRITEWEIPFGELVLGEVSGPTAQDVDGSLLFNPRLILL